MIISEEQVRLAVRYLQTPSVTSDTTLTCEVPPELLDRVKDALALLPECREERVVDARDRLAAMPPSADEIAEKMIGRIISDSLR